MTRVASARVLLAEDDPVSRSFLTETLRGLGCEVCAVADGNEALYTARNTRFDALMLDHHLPGMNGDAVLRGLRADARGASRAVIAIATTAEPDPDIHSHLRNAGFAQVLTKPLDAARLRAAFVAAGIAIARAPLDDAAGLAASGSAEALAALRGLFTCELDALVPEWDRLRENTTALVERLHRLRAACGFCGAVALQDAAAKLADSLRVGARDEITTCRENFRECLEATRTALDSAPVQ